MVISKLSIDNTSLPFENDFAGGELKWFQPIRIRHFTTRLYLQIDDKNGVGVTENCDDPRIIFRLHPTGQV